MVIDFHTHIFTDKIAKTAVSNLAKKGNVKNYLDGDTGSAGGVHGAGRD